MQRDVSLGSEHQGTEGQPAPTSLQYHGNRKVKNSEESKWDAIFQSQEMFSDKREQGRPEWAERPQKL